MAVASVWVALYANAASRQQAAVAQLSEMQITVHYDHQLNALSSQQLALRGSGFGQIPHSNHSPANLNALTWLQQMVGDHYFQTASAVTIFTNEMPDIVAALPYLKKLPNLKEILLSGPSCIHAIPAHAKAKELFKRELPDVKVVGFGIPSVG